MATRIINLGALAILISTAMLLEGSAATTYIVGDSLGWRIPSNGASDYANWASQHTFTVGDVLVFNFPTGQHDVARVTKAAFDVCNSTSPISLITVGPTNITLGSAGEEYFFCTFGQHCLAGQKLAINVTAATSPSPSPAPTPGITPSPSPVPTPSPSPIPSPPSPSPSNLPPSPTPSGVATPPSPPSPGTPPPESSPPPGSTPPPPSDNLSPPPPPNSTPATAFTSIFVIFISAAIGIMC